MGKIEIMSAEEALNILEKSSSMVFKTGKDYEQAINTAVKALKLQIPKKPEKEYFSIDSSGKIPTCSCGNQYIDEEDNYCSHCGQKLYWGDDKHHEKDT